MTEIKKGNQKFYIGDSEENPIAEITFKNRDENTIIAEHTYVSDELRGQGVAGKLLTVLTDYARKENLKIVPECSYVQTKMENSDKYQDLIAE